MGRDCQLIITDRHAKVLRTVMLDRLYHFDAVVTLLCGHTLGALEASPLVPSVTMRKALVSAEIPADKERRIAELYWRMEVYHQLASRADVQHEYAAIADEEWDESQGLTIQPLEERLKTPAPGHLPG